MQKRISILGDPALVGEYAAACAQHGFDIQPFDGSVCSADIVLELTNLSIDAKKHNLIRLEKSISDAVPILSSSVTFTVAEQIPWMKHAERLIGIGAFPTLLQGSIIEFAASTVTDSVIRTSAEEFATMVGKEAVFVRDSAGLVMPRILSMLMNEAFFAMNEGVAAGPDIDTAMKLGTNYPHGPVEWAQRVGADQVHAVISAMQKYYGEGMYRAAPPP